MAPQEERSASIQKKKGDREDAKPFLYAGNSAESLQAELPPLCGDETQQPRNMSDLDFIGTSPQILLQDFAH